MSRHTHHWVRVDYATAPPLIRSQYRRGFRFRFCLCGKRQQRFLFMWWATQRFPWMAGVMS